MEEKEITAILKSETATYKSPIGNLFKKVLKILASLGLSAVVAVSAFLLTSCKNDTPTIEPEQPGITSPVDPVDPEPSNPVEPVETINLEQAKKDYDKIVENIANANSLSATITVDGESEKVEIQDNKMIVTNTGVTYYETQDGVTYVYTVDENGDYTKTIAEDELSASVRREDINTILENITWTEVDENGQLIGNVNDPDGTPITCTYDATSNSVLIKTSSRTFTISDVNSTEVTLPSEYTDITKPAEKFKITEENYDDVMAAARTHIENMNMLVLGTKSQVLEIKDVYLTKSTDSEIFDTIGAVYTAKYNSSEYLEWLEMTIPTEENITYEKIYYNEITYSLSKTTINSLFSFATSRTQESTYSEMVDTLKSKTFGEDYASAEWTGWRCTTGVGADIHTLVIYKDHEIIEYNIRIQNDYTTLSMEEAVNKNFKWQNESDSTYSVYNTSSYNLLENTHNKIFLQIEDKTSELQQDR